MSERCLKIDYESRADVAEWIQCVQDHGYTLPDMVLEIGKGKLTLPNKVGMAFSYGTTCKCCVAYRGMALGAVMLVSGMIIGAAL